MELETLYQLIQDNPKKKANEISEIVGKGLSTVERYLKILKEYDLIKFIGAPKTGGYKVED